MSENRKKGVFLDTLKMWKVILSYIQGSKVLYFVMMTVYVTMHLCYEFNYGILLKNITVGAMEGRPEVILRGVVVFTVFALLLEGFSWMAGHVYVGNTKAKAEYALCTKLFRHVSRLPVSTDANAHSGDAISRMVSDGQNVANALSWDMMGILWPVINLFACGAITLFISWQIGICVIVLGLIFMFVSNKLATPMRDNNKAIKEKQSKAVQNMMDYLTGMQAVRILGLEKPILSRFDHSAGDVKRFSLKNIALSAWQSTLGTMIGSLSSISVFVIGLILVSMGQMELPDVLLIYGFSLSTVYSLINIGHSLTQFQSVAASSKRVIEVFEKEPEDGRVEKPDIQQNIHGDAPILQITDLKFLYREELAPALDGVSFSLKQGEHVALVGESGSGKSTIFRLLLGFYQPAEGDMKLYGNSYKEANLASWRQQFAYVAQESPLFDGTIRENILMGNRLMGEDEMIEAAKKANAHGFISGFAKGYDEQVGELGAKISGGQRQRIAIARALIRNSPILLLDEATSSLDSMNEDLVQEALDRFSQNRTTIIAAHRLSTIQNADCILVFRNGKIVERGNHEALLKKGGVYAGLVQTQALK